MGLAAVLLGSRLHQLSSKSLANFFTSAVLRRSLSREIPGSEQGNPWHAWQRALEHLSLPVVISARAAAWSALDCDQPGLLPQQSVKMTPMPWQAANTAAKLPH